jgi:tetratricopeptide (TPR) repeat protein
MKKSLADKIAEKAMEGAAFKQSWTVHERAFGVLLTGAFSDNAAARVTLCAALNMISQRKAAAGVKKLATLEGFVKTNNDRAMLDFAMALAAELSGDAQKAIYQYAEACKSEPKFYMPYLKLAKYTHAAGDFALAAELYDKAVSYLNESEAESFIKASVYANLCSVYTKMHEYDKAEYALRASFDAHSAQTGREAVAAVLYATVGDRCGVEQSIASLSAVSSPALVQTRDTVERIMSGAHPHFTPQPISEAEVRAFVEWFCESARAFADGYREGDEEAFADEISHRLSSVFPFMQKKISVCVKRRRDGYTLTLSDSYVVALQKGAEKLFADMPKELCGVWEYEICR